MTKQETEARRLVRERSGGVCEKCGACPATNFQHRKNRSQGGQWTASNGLDVCGTGTTGCHGQIHHSPAAAYAAGWSVRSFEDPADVPVRTWRGLVVLDDEGSWGVVDHV